MRGVRCSVGGDTEPRWRTIGRCITSATEKPYWFYPRASERVARGWKLPLQATRLACYASYAVCGNTVVGCKLWRKKCSFISYFKSWYDTRRYAKSWFSDLGKWICIPNLLPVCSCQARFTYLVTFSVTPCFFMVEHCGSYQNYCRVECDVV